MNGLELFVDEIDGRLTAAVVRNSRLDDLYVDGTPAPQWGAIYLGRVAKIDTKLDAAIVDLGDGLQGLLPAKHVRLPGAEHDRRSGIAELLSGGQMIAVQVKSAGKAANASENTKLARLTMKLSLPGLWLTYSPASNHVTISHEVENEALLAMTAKLKGQGGWIVEPAIDHASAAEVESEAQHLLGLWQKISAAAQDSKPGLLHAGPDAMIRAALDYGLTNFEHVYAGSKKILDLLAVWCAPRFPAFAQSKRLRLFKPEKPGAKLFETHDLFGAIDDLKDKVVMLDDGASLIVERTATLTLIDVNQGGAATREAANMAAAKEVARQCRLRTLSGAILVDFINSERHAERAALLEAVTAAFAGDHGGAQVHGFTRLGLLELTRRRRTPTLAENA